MDWGNNTKLGDKIYFNLQKNKGAKLDGLKKFKTDDKLVSGCVEKGKTIPQTVIEEEWKEVFWRTDIYCLHHLYTATTNHSFIL